MDAGWSRACSQDGAGRPGGVGPKDGVERREEMQRRRRNVYRFMDRRGGFDRRERSRLELLLEKPALLVGVLVLLNVLSLIDGFYSSVEVSLGIAQEGNPLLAAAAARHPLLALALKMGSMAFVTVVIWLNRRRRAVLITGLVGLAGYAALVAYHRYVLTITGSL